MAYEKKAFYTNGIDPVDLAKILKKGIEAEQLYIFQFDNPEQMLRDNYERIINYSTPEGMKRLEVQEKQRREEMAKRPNAGPMTGAEEAGWGKAKKGIDWVKKQ